MMNSTLSKIIMFAAGAAVGSAVTWKIMKAKCEQRIQEEIDQLEEYYSSRKESVKEDMIDEKEEAEEDAAETINDILVSEGYVRYSDIKKEDGKEEGMKEPYMITAKEFDTMDDYSAETLLYFADGVLTDDMRNPIEDVELMIGKEALSHFGDDENDPDSVYVRNDNYKTDYEILYDAGTYGG